MEETGDKVCVCKPPVTGERNSHVLVRKMPTKILEVGRH